jgi:hypothetical protein
MRSCFVHLITLSTMVKTEFKIDIILVRLINLIFLLYNGDVAANVDYLHVKRIHILNFSYIE